MQNVSISGTPWMHSGVNSCSHLVLRRMFLVEQQLSSTMNSSNHKDPQGDVSPASRGQGECRRSIDGMCDRQERQRLLRYTFETPIVLAQSSYQVLQAIEKLPAENYHRVKHAAPYLIEMESDPVLFLRCCDFDVSQAARQLERYWDRRLALFPKFEPLSLCMLSAEDQEWLEEGHVAIIQKQDEIILVENILLGQQPRPQCLFWFMAAVASHVTKRGVVWVRCGQPSLLDDYTTSVPIRVAKMCFCGGKSSSSSVGGLLTKFRPAKALDPLWHELGLDEAILPSPDAKQCVPLWLQDQEQREETQRQTRERQIQAERQADHDELDHQAERRRRKRRRERRELRSLRRRFIDLNDTRMQLQAEQRDLQTLAQNAGRAVVQRQQEELLRIVDTIISQAAAILSNQLTLESLILHLILDLLTMQPDSPGAPPAVAAAAPPAQHQGPLGVQAPAAASSRGGGGDDGPPAGADNAPPAVAAPACSPLTVWTLEEQQSLAALLLLVLQQSYPNDSSAAAPDARR